MAKPFEGLPATVLQTPAILGQGLQDVFRSKQIEAAQQPNPTELKIGDPFEIPYYDELGGEMVQAAAQPLVSGTYLDDLDDQQVTRYISKTPLNQREADLFRRKYAEESMTKSLVNNLAKDTQSGKQRYSALQEKVLTDEMFNLPENIEKIERGKAIVTAGNEPLKYGFKPTPSLEKGRAFVPVMDWGYQMLTDEEKEASTGAQPLTDDAGRPILNEDGTQKVVHFIPAETYRKYLTGNFEIQKASSLRDKLLSTAVGSRGVTTERPIEGQEGMYVTVGNKYVPKQGIGSAAGSLMFFNFDSNEVDQMGNVSPEYLSSLRPTGYLTAEARNAGMIDETQTARDLTAQQRMELYRNVTGLKQAVSPSSTTRTLSGTGKGGGGYTNKLGAAPLQAQGKDLTQITVTDDAGMQRTRKGLGASIKPYVIKTSNPKNNKETYMIVSDIFSTTNEKGEGQVYLKGQYVSLKPTDVFMDEGIDGINKRLESAEDPTTALSDFVLSEQPTKWMLPNDQLESQYRANLGRTVKETIDFNKLYNIPYAIRGMEAPSTKKKEDETVDLGGL